MRNGRDGVRGQMEMGVGVGADLLTETDTWAGVKGEEDERVRREVLLQPFVEEPVRVEFHRCFTVH